MKKLLFVILFCISKLISLEKIDLGIDVFFKENKQGMLKNKKIALLINHTSVNKNLKPTLDLFLENASNYKITKIFTPEHGLNGSELAGEKGENSKSADLCIYSLHSDHKRPTPEMLKDVDVIIYDIQEIGCRSYTFATTLYYVMEEAVKKNIKIIVLDRPNPINGLTIDGAMLEDEYRSFLGYINVPYCHGLTIGELAIFFNSEYKIGCDLEIVKMNGWKRDMSFSDTKLNWIPTSPNIPESDTPLFYATTGILGELELVSIGIGYTLPFKIVGAPWIDAKMFSENLNKQKLNYVKFIPYYFRPFYGPYKGQDCQGVKIEILDKINYRPLTVGYLIIGILKSLYSEILSEKLKKLPSNKIDTFCKVNGNKEIYNLLINEKYAAWKMIQFQEDKIKEFQEKRKKYLLY
jgi:uncharacterized protein YbbC (DUF1343 family)